MPALLEKLLEIEFLSNGESFSVLGAPYFLELPSFKLAAYQNNESLVGYAVLLNKLGSPGLVNAEEVERTAADLNANVRSSALAINPDISAKTQGSLAIVSTLAGGLMKKYLKDSQKQSTTNSLKPKMNN